MGAILFKFSGMPSVTAKASDAEIAQHVVDLKSEIEKLREQIQNVE